jgi:hypothetical protein
MVPELFLQSKIDAKIILIYSLWISDFLYPKIIIYF